MPNTLLYTPRIQRDTLLYARKLSIYLARYHSFEAKLWGPWKNYGSSVMVYFNWDRNDQNIMSLSDVCEDHNDVSNRLLHCTS